MTQTLKKRRKAQIIIMERKAQLLHDEIDLNLYLQVPAAKEDRPHHEYLFRDGRRHRDKEAVLREFAKAKDAGIRHRSVRISRFT